LRVLNNILEEARKKEFPFVIYRKPHSDKIIGVFQQDNGLNYSKDLRDDGFIFAPFNDAEKTVLIPYSKAKIYSFNLEDSVFKNLERVFSFSETEKRSHIELVEKGIDFIENSNVDKVVLSRKEEVEVHDFQLLESFENLCRSYPNAFVYLWSHLETGIWMGASPERLLTVQNNTFKVMALASTQEFIGEMDVEWGAKEVEEHQYVVDYIADKINDFDLTISDVYTIKAGNLLHLRADLNGVISENNTSLEPLIRVLHPTPAVCGLPKDESKLFILKNENYNREFYTGFLGELRELEADLFVNLRCMKVDLINNKVIIFVGGGITKDSNPEKEWLETVAKTNVMKKVLI
jgi:isochorismate synthase